LAEEFWPGPLTLIAPKTDAVSSLITSGLETVALRSPRHPLAREILKNLKTPLAAPSANRFGKTSPTSAAHVAGEFGDRVAIVDGGQCQVGVESTVIRAERAGEKWIVHVLRPGGISRAQLETALKRSGLDFEVRKPEAQAASPGHLKFHYQPESPLVIFSADFPEADLLSSIQKKWPQIQRANPLILSAEPQQAARQLYSELRRLSEKEAAIVFKMRPEFQNPSWEAIIDRLQRASTLVL
jgi:L-threonylcarbamoyladenylate synthase